jgi:hypothetical protein
MLIQLRTASKTLPRHATHCARERNGAADLARPIRDLVVLDVPNAPRETSRSFTRGPKISLTIHRLAGSVRRSEAIAKWDRKPNLRRPNRCAKRWGRSVVGPRFRATQLLGRAIQRCCKYAVMAKRSPRGQALVMFAGYSIRRWRLSEPWPESEMPLVRPGDPLSGSLFCPKS